MPVIKFETKDVLKSKVLEDKWYSFEIREIPAAVVNAGGDGFNYKVRFALIDAGEEMNGKEIERTFSSKAIGMMIPLVAAARGIPLSDIPVEGFQLDTDELVGKKIDGHCKIEIYNGNPNNKVEEYAPYKSVVGKAMAF